MTAYLKTAQPEQNTKSLLAFLLAPVVVLQNYSRAMQRLKNNRPEWALHIPKRSWCRHAAYLTCLHEIQLDK